MSCWGCRVVHRLSQDQITDYIWRWRRSLQSFMVLHILLSNSSNMSLLELEVNRAYLLGENMYYVVMEHLREKSDEVYVKVT